MSDHAARFARLEFERFQPRAFEDFGGIRDRFAEMAVVFTPLEVVDALGVYLRSSRDPHRVAEAAIAFAHHRAESPAPTWF